VSLDFADSQPRPALITRVEGIFRAADSKFSLYKPDSELSRIASGQLALTDASAELLEVYSQSVDWLLKTDGSFTAHRPDGVLDLSGIVKAWAMEAAVEVFRNSGIRNWALGVGGDVVTAGSPADSDRWTIGIVDPSDRSRLLTAISLSPERPALATSGSAERGDHIWRTPDHPIAHYVQVSVAGTDIITADVLATAIVSGGASMRDRASDGWDVDILTVDTHGEITMTPRMRSAMHDAARA
jgi:thiamine biosynthesis lipoprotein